MMIIPRISTRILLSVLALSLAWSAAGAEAGSSAEVRKNLQWAFTPDPALPNVLILGDSISIGYTLQVRDLLKGRANVFRPVSKDGSSPVNCNGTTVGVEKIDEWLAGRKWDVIHFNWGLHDLKHVQVAGTGPNSDRPSDPLQADPGQYGKNMEVLVGKLKATGARLIFATTTPVAPGTTHPLREPDSPGRYNAVAREIMRKHGVEVNDLHAFCQPQLARLQLPKNVHFTPAGSKALAEEVAKSIGKQLESPGRKP